MSNLKADFYSRRHFPGRFTLIEAAWYLGFSEQDITVLVSSKLLKPLGRPAPNSTKYFAIAYLERLRLDVPWYDRATQRINKYWRDKNERRTPNENPSPNIPSKPAYKKRPSL